MFFCNNVFPDSSVFPAQTSDFHSGCFAMGPRCFLQQWCFFCCSGSPILFATFLATVLAGVFLQWLAGGGSGSGGGGRSGGGGGGGGI